MSAPRVLVVMEAQWPRALLLAALQEAGYDAHGAPTPQEALVYPAEEPGRGPLGLIILDHHSSGDESLLAELLRRHPRTRTLFLQSAFGPPAANYQKNVLRYPTSIGEIMRSVQEVLRHE